MGSLRWGFNKRASKSDAQEYMSRVLVTDTYGSVAAVRQVREAYNARQGVTNKKLLKTVEVGRLRSGL